MGKTKTPRKAGATASSPYDRQGSKGAATPSKGTNIFRFNKDFGQHILKNPGVADAIVAKAQLRPTDVVLEVGPGSGNLTVRILQIARKVIAVELDPRMAAEVTKRVQGTPMQKKLEVVLGDVIKMDLPPFDVLISNTPYQISSPLVFKLLSHSNWRTAVLMFQREFALRLTAKPGDTLYNRLSVNSNLLAKVTHVLKVGKANFKPMPQVESSVVKLEPRLGKDRPNVDFHSLDSVLRICFNRANRTLRAAWMAKEVLAMATKNYRIWASMNNISLDERLVESSNGVDDDAEEADQMDVDVAETSGHAEAGGEEPDEWTGFDMETDGDDDTPAFFKEMAAESTSKQTIPKTPSKKKKTKVEVLVREKILKALESTELSERRARQCEENDFLRLLFALNEEGIIFS